MCIWVSCFASGAGCTHCSSSYFPREDGRQIDEAQVWLNHLLCTEHNLGFSFLTPVVGHWPPESLACWWAVTRDEPSQVMIHFERLSRSQRYLLFPLPLGRPNALLSNALRRVAFLHSIRYLFMLAAGTSHHGVWLSSSLSIQYRFEAILISASSPDWRSRSFVMTCMNPP